MPWVGVSWEDGDFLFEEKLDNMQGNADLMREESSRFRLVASHPSEGSLRVQGTDGVTYTWSRVSFELDGTTWDSGWIERHPDVPAASGPWLDVPQIPKNEDISAVARGAVYELEIRLGLALTQAGAGSRVGAATIFVVEDMNRISFFAQHRWRDNRTVELRNFVALATRNEESL